MGVGRGAVRWGTRALVLKIIGSLIGPLTFIVIFAFAVGSLALIGGYGAWEENQQLQAAARSCSNPISVSEGSTTVNVPQEYKEAIDKAGKESGIPAQIIAAQIQAESNWNPKAESPAGAKGLTQFIPSTWEAIAPGEDPFDPFASIAAQGRYMKQMKEQLEHLAGGDANKAIELALAGYNAGPGAVVQYKGIPPFPETQNYVVKIMGTSQMTYSKGCSQVAKVWDGDLGDGEWTNPCPGCVKTSGFAPRALAVDAQNHFVHWGVDLASPGVGNNPGTEIVAPVKMKITDIYEADGCVFATATEGPEFGFSFCHLHSYDVNPGMEVERGTVIGVEGGTGGGVKNAFSTHLHLEIYKPGFDYTNFKWFTARTGWDNPGGNIDPEPILIEKGAMTCSFSISC